MGNHNSHKANKEATVSLFKAAEEGNCGDIKTAIEAGIDVNVTPKETEGNSVLHVCVSKGHIACIKLLLDNNADVNIHNYEGRTPAMLAAAGGQTHILEQLLDHPQCNVNLLSRHNDTCLHEAVRNGHRACVTLLLEKRPEIDVNTKNKEKLTAFQLAAKIGYFDIVKQIVEASTVIMQDPDLRHGVLKALITNTRAEEDPELMQYLIKRGFECNHLDLHGQNNMHLAAQHNRLKYALLLFRHGLSVNTVDMYGMTPLCHAVRNSNLEMVKLLLSLGADPNVDLKNTAYADMNPVYQAAVTGEPGSNLEILKLLLPKVDISLLVPTPIEPCIQSYRIEELRVLLSNGGATIALPDHNDTVLHFCATYGQRNILPMMWDLGAMSIINNKNNSKQTPLDVAIAYNDEAIAVDLVNMGAELPKDGIGFAHVCNTAIRQDMDKFITLVLENPYTPPRFKDIAIQEAVKRRSLKCFRLLLKAGAEHPEIASPSEIVSSVYLDMDPIKTQMMILTGADNNMIMTIKNNFSANSNPIITLPATHTPMSAALFHLSASPERQLKRQFTDLVILLLQTAGTETPNGSVNWSVHFQFLDWSNIELFKTFDEVGIDYKVDKNGDTVLHHILVPGADKDHFEAMKYALQSGCSSLVDTASAIGTTPLWRASFLGLDYLAALLIDNGADINMPAKGARILTQCSCLTIAIYKKQFTTTQLLIAKGARVDDIDEILSYDNGASLDVGQIGFKQVLLDTLKNRNASQKPALELMNDPHLLKNASGVSDIVFNLHVANPE